MAKKPTKKAPKKKPSKYEEKFIIPGSFEEIVKEMGKPVKKGK